MKIGEKIQELREQQNLSRYRLSKDTGVSGDHIRGIEEGTRQPTIDTLNRLLLSLRYSTMILSVHISQMMKSVCLKITVGHQKNRNQLC